MRHKQVIAAGSRCWEQTHLLDTSKTQAAGSEVRAELTAEEIFTIYYIWMDSIYVHIVQAGLIILRYFGLR